MATTQSHPKTRETDPLIAVIELSVIAPVCFALVVGVLLFLAHGVPDAAFKLAFWAAFLGAIAFTLAITQLYHRVAGANGVITLVVPIVAVTVLTAPVLFYHSQLSDCAGGPAYPFNLEACSSSGPGEG